MDTRIPREPSDLHILPEAEVERLALWALASEALIAHAEELEERARLAAEELRTAQARRAA